MTSIIVFGILVSFKTIKLYAVVGKVEVEFKRDWDEKTKTWKYEGWKPCKCVLAIHSTLGTILSILRKLDNTPRVERNERGQQKTTNLHLEGIHIKIVKKSSPEIPIASNQISHGQDSTDGVIRKEQNVDDSHDPSKTKTDKEIEEREDERRFEFLESDLCNWSTLGTEIKDWNDFKIQVQNTNTISKIQVQPLMESKKMIELRRGRAQKLNTMTCRWGIDMFADRRRMKSKLYNNVLILTGVFYAVPTMQLMFMAQHVINETGSDDVCYYNYLCRYQFGIFQDYGHLFTNIPYIFCGILFYIIVRIRQKARYNAMEKIAGETSSETKDEESRVSGFDRFKFKLGYAPNNELKNKIGIPEQYGIFYAMGCCLIFIGILSGCYHLCPVKESFQFDTTFMYVASALVYSKVYQFRHPDATPRAYYLYGIIAVLLVFETLGYYVPTSKSNINAFNGFYLVVFYLGFLAIVFSFYKKMYLQGDKDLREKWYSDPRKRRALIIFLMIANVVLTIVFACRSFYNKDSVISKNLLALFGGNMAIYVMYYILNKYYHAIRDKNYNETINGLCWMYITLCIICLGVGFSYFTASQKDKSKSPSMSRNLNEECTMWFFDNHDIWHFASAFGIFFAFMALLTMEDNNTTVPWNEIPVF